MTAQSDPLICQGCGAQLTYAAGLQALQCAYCETVTPIPRAAAMAGKTGQRIIPLSVDDKAFAFGVLRSLSLNHEVPDDMVERAVLSVKASYLPCLAHDVSYTASWTASFTQATNHPGSGNPAVRRHGRRRPAFPGCASWLPSRRSCGRVRRCAAWPSPAHPCWPDACPATRPAGS
ncbi:hypothetical protein F1609_16670 [Massilia sp. CCM 8693]|uniref:Uncharacterized protein n=1 Tax=Massilia aquatica TaxID=2609000 RepID=A0ABX0M5B2_9BURK|nr:hypothetical protein [Massilia aquatica]